MGGVLFLERIEKCVVVVKVSNLLDLPQYNEVP